MQNLTSFSYNFKGQLTRREDALGNTTNLSYVGTGCASCGGGGEKLTSLTDPAGSRTSFSYDQRGLLTYVTDPLQKVTSLTYDVRGRPVAKTDRNGTLLTYAYTPTGNPASITYPDQTQVTNTFDDLGRLTQTQDAMGTSSYTHDGAGRITAYTNPDGVALSYTYDAAGNLTQLTYPDGTHVAYAYDAANRLITVTNWAGEQATYAHDQAGRLASFTHFNGITTTYTYDIASRLTGMASPIASYLFSLDANGNRINSTETEPLTATPSPASNIYTYNSKKNRLLSAESVNYAYDDEGQLASAGTTALTFDFDHRLVGINDGSAVSQFSYDARDNRLRAVRDGVTTRYIYDPYGNLLAEADEQNQITRKYIYAKGLLSLATLTSRYCYHFNATGHTVALTDSAQTVVNSYAYDPFGQILAQQESIPQPFKFVGQYGVMAEPNGLYYMRARYYDPSVGRFISEDPLGFGGGDVNLSAYVRNDPVNRIDPSGLLDIARIEGDFSGGYRSDSFFTNAPTGPDLFQLGWNILQDMFYTNLLGRGQETLSAEIPIGNLAGRLIGQIHHAISARVFQALERNPSLAGLYKMRDSRFATQAKDLPCHKGYQKWHRSLDQEVVNWIETNRLATPQQFESFLHQRYASPDLINRFPNGF